MPSLPLRTAFAAAWGARADLGFAWDVLRHGVCGDCALGCGGTRDGLLPGGRLCPRRLDGLPRELARPFALEDLPPLPRLRLMEAEALAELGRLPGPLLARRDDVALRALSWEDAAHLAARRLAEGPWGLLCGDRALSCEGAFALRELVEALGGRSALREPSAALRAALSDRPVLDLATLPDAPRAVLWGDPLASAPMLEALLPAEVVRSDAGAGAPPGGVHLVGAGWTDPGPLLALPPDEPILLLEAGPAAAAARACGLDREPPEALLALPTLVFAGEGPAVPEPPLRKARFRLHLAQRLLPEALAEARGELLLLPTTSLFESPGGATLCSLDGRVRFSPQVLGRRPAEARPDHAAVAAVLAAAAPPPTDAPAEEPALAIRRRMASDLPGWAPITNLLAPGDAFRLPELP